MHNSTTAVTHRQVRQRSDVNLVPLAEATDLLVRKLCPCPECRANPARSRREPTPPVDQRRCQCSGNIKRFRRAYLARRCT